jgi:hypothetical protein
MREINEKEMSEPIYKQVLTIGKTKMVSIDESIVKKLNINEENTFLQQEVMEDGSGILMRIKKLDGI